VKIDDLVTQIANLKDMNDALSKMKIDEELKLQALQAATEKETIALTLVSHDHESLSSDLGQLVQDREDSEFLHSDLLHKVAAFRLENENLETQIQVETNIQTNLQNEIAIVSQSLLQVETGNATKHELALNLSRENDESKSMLERQRQALGYEREEGIELERQVKRSASLKEYLAMQLNPWSFVEDYQRQSNYYKTVLVIGETGAGKSTFINIATNFFMKGSVDNLRIAIPTTHHSINYGDTKHSETNVADKSQSQTNDSKEYPYVDGNDKLVFIDTPGLGDTRGIAQDEKNMDIILKAAENARNFSAIVIIVNGQVARFTLVRKNCHIFRRFYKFHFVFI
jgi:GTP-binding protein EngB required for normal cell division